MRPGVAAALIIALVAMGSSLGLGLYNRLGISDAGLAIQADQEAYITGGYRAGEVRSLVLHQDTRRGWLDSGKLASLGFRKTAHGSPLARPAYIVLERDTILTVIDGGLDPDALEIQYPDRSRYLVLRGLIGAYFYTSDPAGDGYVRQLLPPRLYLPPGVGRTGPFRLHAGRLNLPFVTLPDR